MVLSLLSKSYDAQAVESHWLHRWFDAGLFSPDASDSLTKDNPKEPYVIMMPPPNVTGSLHNGHALFVTLQDILVRYHRMLGKNTLWLPGVDHAGISTQTVVERELMRTKGQTRHDIGREAFIKLVWEWKEKHAGRIVEQLKLLGASADWDRCLFTLDEQCSKAVREAFVRLWDEGLIYRGERLVNWDPTTQTALSNEEVEHEERQGELFLFAYLLKNKPDTEIVVATTRPETMLGDTAVAVHPNDVRYQHLIGQQLAHPFFKDRMLSIVADEAVDPTFGTGAVKITPAHDPVDFEIGKRHQLAMINIFTLDGKINPQGGVYVGLDRKEARSRIRKDLESLGVTRGTKPITHRVGISQRSGADIEPMLSRQYFVHTKPLAEKACQAVDAGKTQIFPENWLKTWNHFMHNIQDWCISRQLWWGHPIPVFYDLEKMKEVVLKEPNSESHQQLQNKAPLLTVLRTALRELEDHQVRTFSVASTLDLAKEHPGEFVQEEDVLDTWFSSGLWPFSTLGWPEQTKELQAFYPSCVLETGFDILFFWVARMMMLGVHLMGQVPFRHVYLHAMVRDAQGRKMSKSLGNTIDPADVIFGISLEGLIEKVKTYPVPSKLLPKVIEGLEKDYPKGIPPSGADGLRLSLAILSGQGRDVKLSIPRVAGYRSFLNKVWNATRMVLMHEDLQALDLPSIADQLTLADRFILSRLQKTTQKIGTGLDSYAFSEAAEAIYHFFWSELCDWYLEISKPRLEQDAPEKDRQVAFSVLIHVLEQSMRLLHPFCPFISEEIWQMLPIHEGKQEQHCAVAAYPIFDQALIDAPAEHDMALLQQAIAMIRNGRQESNIPVSQKVDAIIMAANETIQTLLQHNSGLLERLAKTGSLSIVLRQGQPINTHHVLNSSSTMDVAIVLQGLFESGAEKARLEKELAKCLKEKEGIESKLSNPLFSEKAPKHVVEQYENTLLSLINQIQRIEQAIQQLQKS